MMFSIFLRGENLAPAALQLLFSSSDPYNETKGNNGTAQFAFSSIMVGLKNSQFLVLIRKWQLS